MSRERDDAAAGPPDRSAEAAEANDPTALNGGPARHWFLSGERERARTPLRGVKVAVAIGIWGALALGLLIFAASFR